MKFIELKSCPFCGNDEYYTHNHVVSGTNEFNERFDGEEAADNSQMYDSISFVYGAKCYCNACFKYIGNRYSDKLGVAAERALKERETE